MTYREFTGRAIAAITGAVAEYGITEDNILFAEIGDIPSVAPFVVFKTTPIITTALSGIPMAEITAFCGVTADTQIEAHITAIEIAEKINNALDNEFVTESDDDTPSEYGFDTFYSTIAVSYIRFVVFYERLN
jgi:hypothetical protein